MFESLQKTHIIPIYCKNVFIGFYQNDSFLFIEGPYRKIGIPATDYEKKYTIDFFSYFKFLCADYIKDFKN